MDDGGGSGLDAAVVAVDRLSPVDCGILKARSLLLGEEDRGWGMLAGQHRLRRFLHQLLTRPGYRGDAGIRDDGDLAVTPPCAGIGGTGLQQDARIHELACTLFAILDQCVINLPTGLSRDWGG